jgi:hypothetical protein
MASKPIQTDASFWKKLDGTLKKAFMSQTNRFGVACEPRTANNKEESR